MKSIKRVLVTGSRGQLGQTIREVYSEKKTKLEFTFVSREILDITNFEEVKSFFNNSNFDCCINCAAYTNVEKAEKSPKIAFKVNAESVKHLAQACKDNEILLIHISTDYVFDGEKVEPYTEEDPPNPINQYGKSKLLGELYIQKTLDNYLIIRTSWLYSKNGNNFLNKMLAKKDLEEIKVISSQIGTPTSTRSLTLAIFRLISNMPQSGIYHYSDDGSCSWADFAIAIFKEKNIEKKIIPVLTINGDNLAKRPIYSVLDKEKIAKILGVEIPFWRDNLKQTLS